MKPFKSLLYTLSVATIMGALTIAPAQRSQASNTPITTPQIKYRPDLVVSDVAPVYSSAIPGIGRILVKDQVWVKVTNQGPGAAGTFCSMFAWADGYGNQIGLFTLMGGLAPGQSYWFLADAHGYDLWDPNHRFAFIVNYDAGIVETDYSNDTYKRP